MLEKLKDIVLNHKKEVIVSVFLILVLSIFFIGSAFAALTPIKNITITSKNSSYENKESGSWKIEKNAKWIYKRRARVSFEVDTTVMSKTNNTDVMMVLDVSDSMSGNNKLESIKQSSIELIENVLSNSNNNVSLISFADDYNILSSFTDDKDTLINQINNLQATGSTNYYQALVGVDNVLKDYIKQDDRDVVVLFVSGGYPNVDTPNQIAQYKYLKEAYPYTTINAIQYEFGKEILSCMKEISDYQFLANSNTLMSVLDDASVKALEYDQFQIIDYIDNRYFNLKSIDDVTVSQGEVELEYENAKQKIVWVIDNLKSGEDIKLTMDIDLKPEYVGKGGVYPTNVSEEIITKIGDKEENVISTETPSLAEGYSVIYEGNAPDGTNVSNIPDESYYSAFETVSISEDEPICEGYEFKGWEIVTEGVTRIGDDHFIMSASDVVLRAKWSKVEIAKTMEGVVSGQGEPVMMGQSWWNTDYEKEKVTSIEVKTSTEIPDSAIAYWDASQAQDRSVVAYIEDDGNGDYKVSIGGLGGVIANNDCSSLFYGFTNAKTIRLNDFDTSNVTNMSRIFYNCSSLTNLNLSNFDTSKVTGMSSMFYNCSSLTNLNLSNFDTAKVGDMTMMFYACKSLVNLDLSNFDTSKVHSMSNMFNVCINLISLDLSNFDTSKVVNMYAMFRTCYKLTYIDCSTFDTSNVINMGFMFAECPNLMHLGLSSFDTSNVTNMNHMFYNCTSLTSLDLSNFDTSSVTNMNYMFYNCTSLTGLDLKSFDTSEVVDMSHMFRLCSLLINLDVSSFDTSKVTNMQGMFDKCSSLVELDLSNFDTSNVTLMGANSGASYGGMFRGCSSLTKLDISNFDTSNVINMKDMFNGCNKLVNLSLSNFDTSKVIDMRGMFSNCSSLVSLDLSNFDTSSVTNMSNMFSGCSNLISINLSSFDTSNVTKMDSMFQDCQSINTLDLSGFDTSKVTTMVNMFYHCYKLVNIDLTNFNTSNVTEMYGMFYHCSSLEKVDVSMFDTSNVKSFSASAIYSGMFSNCSSLISLDLSNFDTSNVTNMSYMFFGCTSLTTLDISNFDTSNVISMEGMFDGCKNLVALNVKSFNTSNVTNMHAMFNSCSSLMELDLNNFDTSRVINMKNMFQWTSRLLNLDFRNAEFNVTTYNAMFNGTNLNINVIVKDSTAQSWIRSRLDEVNRPDATVTIAGDLNTGVDGVSDSVINGADIHFRMEDINSTLDFNPLPLRYGVRFNMFSRL